MVETAGIWCCESGKILEKIRLLGRTVARSVGVGLDEDLASKLKRKKRGHGGRVLKKGHGSAFHLYQRD